MRGLLVCLLLLVGVAGAQDDHGFLEFHFVRAGLPVPEYTIYLDQGGGGKYSAESAGVPSANKYSVAGAVGGGKTRQAVELTVNMRERVFRLAQATNGLSHCDAHRKGIADTGAKTLRFHEAWKTAADGSFTTYTCTYNYSEDKAVVELTNVFQGMAATLDMGRKMERDQKYDRLALDGDMTTLSEMVKDGQAVGLASIGGTLRGLADDAAVLERVRVQAGKLVEFGVGEK